MNNRYFRFKILIAENSGNGSLLLERHFCTSDTFARRVTFARRDTFARRLFCTEGQFCTRWHFCTASLLHAGSLLHKGKLLHEGTLFHGNILHDKNFSDIFYCDILARWLFCTEHLFAWLKFFKQLKTEN